MLRVVTGVWDGVHYENLEQMNQKVKGCYVVTKVIVLAGASQLVFCCAV